MAGIVHGTQVTVQYMLYYGRQTPWRQGLFLIPSPALRASTASGIR